MHNTKIRLTTMNSEFEIRALHVNDRRTRLMVEAFLAENGLRLDTVEQYFGIFRLEEDELLAAGGLYHDIIKCVAVRQEMREERLFNMLVSHLMSVAMQNGYFSTKVTLPLGSSPRGCRFKSCQAHQRIEGGHFDLPLFYLYKQAADRT